MKTNTAEETIKTPAQVRCVKVVNGQQCGLWQHGRKQEHIFRDPKEPNLNKKILILELAKEEHHLWSRLCTGVASPGHMAWLADNGFITEEHIQLNYMSEPYYPVGMYFGFSYSTMAPFNRLTDKGRDFLALHIKAEW